MFPEGKEITLLLMLILKNLTGVSMMDQEVLEREGMHGVVMSTFGDGLRWGKMILTHFFPGKMGFEQNMVNGIYAPLPSLSSSPFRLLPPSSGPSFSVLLYYFQTLHFSH